MILQALNELYDRLKDDSAYDLPQPGYSPQKISFRVVIKPNGTLFDIQDARVPNEKGKLISDRVMCFGNGKRSGKTPKPNTLWDKQSYMLGVCENEGEEEKALAQFDSFRNHHLNLEKDVNHPSFSAVCRFLENWSPDKVGDWPILSELIIGFGVFQIQGEPRLVHENTKIQKWWQNYTENSSNNSDADVGQCLVSGAFEKIARLHDDIKGIRPPKGTQGKNAPLVSFQKNTPYESYTLVQGLNAPISQNVAIKYTATLNALLASSRHCFYMADTTCVFWTDKPTVTENIFPMFISEGSRAPMMTSEDIELREKLQAFLKAVREGKMSYSDIGDNPDETKFFILGLAPNAARISIRFFYQSTLGELLDHLHQHQSDLRIVKRFEEDNSKGFADPDFPAYWMVLNQTVRKGDNYNPLLSGALIRSLVEGSSYPEALYTAVMRRVHVERDINYIKAAILKAILVRNHKQKVSIMLDPDNTEPAYRLGRLFAVLEKTQEDAGNSGVRERFYSSASATPATVFPRILRTYTHHLAKLHQGMKIKRERLVQEIVAPLNGFPNHLGLVEQGLFAIGYYHQRKDLFTTKPKEESETEPENQPQLPNL
ncbi:MAG: type I-C CRISPR-associated protein Cas8c/Csd1 [Verrucomicrobia bacterium]|nr:type I-C CRISPR-associated protein Cas8c/Csd1 [Verrucomicrobiota bacterium]MCH8528950.1 type I-C CRISPR-associated protein Cas8c/Csd1 [Kiritimatiellia bacterium]